MTITLTTLRSQVRDMSDLDATDLSDGVIDQFAREGFQRIYALERRWPILQATYTFNTVADQREYTISTIGDIREIISVVDTSTQGARLHLIDYNQAEMVWLVIWMLPPVHTFIVFGTKNYNYGLNLTSFTQ